MVQVRFVLKRPHSKHILKYLQTCLFSDYFLKTILFIVYFPLPLLQIFIIFMLLPIRCPFVGWRASFIWLRIDLHFAADHKRWVKSNSKLADNVFVHLSSFAFNLLNKCLQHFPQSIWIFYNFLDATQSKTLRMVSTITLDGDPIEWVLLVLVHHLWLF